MHPFINIATEVIEQAGITVCKALHRLDRLKVDDKGTNDPVTQVDRMAEAQIAEMLNESFPTHNIVGEESGQMHSGDGGFTWFIDPLDGTINYLHGLPHFCISIGCQGEKHLEHGLIFDPLKRELFTASKGQGAMLNRTRIRVSNTISLKSALVACGLPYVGRPGDLALLQRFATEASGYSRGLRQFGSTALDLAYTAAGRFDLAFDSGLKVWDLAAGALLIQEAGGLISDHDGSQNFLVSGNFIAGTPRCQRKAVPRIKALMAAAAEEAAAAKAGSD